MKMTHRQLLTVIQETMNKLWADYNPTAINAADAALSILGHDPRLPSGTIENEIHRYLQDEVGLDSTSDRIFELGDEALSVAGLMLGLGPDAL